MRSVIVPIVALALSASARADAPPSKVLERAVKLYDIKDFYSAHIELHKVLDGTSGDDAKNKERAEFFVGKTLFHMGYHVAAMAMFDKIAMNPQHTYYTATLKWYVALAEKLPIDMMALPRFKSTEVEDPMNESTRDQIRFRRGIAMWHQRSAGAATELAGVPKGSPLYPAAQLAIGHLERAAGKQAEALAAWNAVAPGDAGDRAAIAVGQVHARAGQYAPALAAYAKVRASGPNAARAAWEASVVRLAQGGKLKVSTLALPDTTLDGDEPAALAVALSLDYCTAKQPAADGLAAFKRNKLDGEIAAMLARDDNAEFYELVAKSRARPRPSAGDRVVRAVLASPRVASAFAFVDELKRELETLQKSDKAYQTTMAAAEVLQELSVQLSVAEADAGKLARVRLEQLANELGEVRKLAGPLPVGGTGLAVPCDGARIAAP